MTSHHARNEMTEKQARDTGLAMLLICLLCLLASQQTWLICLAIAILLLTMLCPRLFAPLARIWFGLSQLFGTLMSRIILTLVFFLVVTPVAWLRKLFGADAMQIKRWREGPSSVFSVREKTYTGSDLEKPY